MADGSSISVIGALAGNLAVAVIKFAAYLVSGSAAMLTEAIHSLVDTLNQVLLLFGLRQSRRPADANHPFGHGMELYFWTFVVALMIFAIGGAVGILEGLQKFAHPARVTHVWLNLAVIAASAVIEILSLGLSLKAARDSQSPIIRRVVPKLNFFNLMHQSKDPGIYEVLAENAAAVLGLLFATLGVVGSAWLGWPHADAIASLGMGVPFLLVNFDQRTAAFRNTFEAQAATFDAFGFFDQRRLARTVRTLGTPEATLLSAWEGAVRRRDELREVTRNFYAGLATFLPTSR